MRGRFRIESAALLVLCFGACGWGHSVQMLRDSRPFNRRQSLTIVAQTPAGKIRLERGDTRTLYGLQFSYCRDHFAAESRFTQAQAGAAGEAGSRLRIAAREIRPVSHPEEEPNLMLLRLRPGIVLDLRLGTGSGEVEADLTALSVRRLVVHGGAGPLHLIFKAGNPVDLEQMKVVAGTGKTRLEGLGWGSVKSLQFYGGAGAAILDFSGPGPEEAAAFVDPGTGSVEMVFPKDLGVEVSGAGVDPESPPEGLLKGAQTWISPNRQVAQRHLTLIMDRGSEDLLFRWLP
ncbi:MAG: hypothetical protein L0Z52_04890 [Acidobacteria bacterium]|nr:hypothetical protein [Acidobacteriota bacterium]